MNKTFTHKRHDSHRELLLNARTGKIHAAMSTKKLMDVGFIQYARK